MKIYKSMLLSLGLAGLIAVPALTKDTPIETPVFRLLSHHDIVGTSKHAPVEKNTLTVVQKGPNSTVFLMQLHTPVPPHFHALHDEYFVLKQGQGTLFVKENGTIKHHILKAGDVFHVPMGIEHAFIPETGLEVRGLGHYSPAWNDVDRHAVDWEKAWALPSSR